MCQAEACAFFLRATPGGTGYRSDRSQNDVRQLGKPERDVEALGALDDALGRLALEELVQVDRLDHPGQLCAQRLPIQCAGISCGAGRL